MDDMDRAQELEQAQRDEALRRTRERIAESMRPRNAAVERECIECRQPIEPDRLAVLRTSRCFECAKVYEMRARSGRP